jgi:hypothetical protein
MKSSGERSNPGQVLASKGWRSTFDIAACWHWKAAVLSAMFRGLVFLFANLRAGQTAAARAMAIEILFAALASGAFGAVAQRLRRTEPKWLGGIVAGVLLPGIAHLPEGLIHWAAHTPKLKTSVIASMVATVVSGLFNWYAMHRGVLLVGEGGRSLASDMRVLPAMAWDFVTAAPRWLRRVTCGG